MIQKLTQKLSWKVEKKKDTKVEWFKNMARKLKGRKQVYTKVKPKVEGLKSKLAQKLRGPKKVDSKVDGTNKSWQKSEGCSAPEILGHFWRQLSVQLFPQLCRAFDFCADLCTNCFPTLFIFSNLFVNLLFNFFLGVIVNFAYALLGTISSCNGVAAPMGMALEPRDRQPTSYVPRISC